MSVTKWESMQQKLNNNVNGELSHTLSDRKCRLTILPLKPFQNADKYKYLKSKRNKNEIIERN
jgi:hypothetical protein